MNQLIETKNGLGIKSHSFNQVLKQHYAISMCVLTKMLFYIFLLYMVRRDLVSCHLTVSYMFS